MELKTIAEKLLDLTPDTIRIGLRPSPTGVMTLGNLKGAILIKNLLKQFEKYGKKTKFLLRFDDTNPLDQYKPEYYASFDYYSKIFGLDWDEITYCSDYIKNKQYEKYVNLVLKKKLGFVCSCAPKTLNEEDDCSCEFSESLQKLRVGDLTNETVKYKFLCSGKSQVIYRKINDVYCPTLVFQGPVDDYRQAHTLILRGRDLQSVGLKQKQLYEALFNNPYPRTFYWGRITLWDSVSGSTWNISKSLLKDTTDFPSLEFFMKSGYSAEAIENWILSANFTKNDIKWDLVKLNHFQKQSIIEALNFKTFKSSEQLQAYTGYFLITDQKLYGFKREKTLVYGKQLLELKKDGTSESIL